MKLYQFALIVVAIAAVTAALCLSLVTSESRRNDERRARGEQVGNLLIVEDKARGVVCYEYKRNGVSCVKVTP